MCGHRPAMGRPNQIVIIRWIWENISLNSFIQRRVVKASTTGNQKQQARTARRRCKPKQTAKQQADRYLAWNSNKHPETNHRSSVWQGRIIHNSPSQLDRVQHKLNRGGGLNCRMGGTLPWIDVHCRMGGIQRWPPPITRATEVEGIYYPHITTLQPCQATYHPIWYHGKCRGWCQGCRECRRNMMTESIWNVIDGAKPRR